jgi:holo-[acyl-carrier protein] synthase
MVRGIGTDIVAVERIALAIDTYGERFVHKIFTDREIEYCSAKAQSVQHFAGRWAAKEAFYKAIPASCQPFALWHSIEINANADGTGKPVMLVCSSLLQKALDFEGIANIHLSISHEKTQCVAFVVVTGISV